MNNGAARRIDMRSDTVTTPTEAMRRAMADAEVGDDVYGEDPTVNRLEAMVAEMLGKEAAVFVSSGTMGNLVSVLSHCGRGEEVILGDKAHIHLAEQGGIAALGGIHSRTVPNQPDGTLDLGQVAALIRPDNMHYPVSRLLCLENTQNVCGGQTLSAEYTDKAAELAHTNGMSLHVDGARLWNASVALNVAPARLVEEADSVSVCLSKGLGAPVGSVVAGSAEFVHKARRNRKVVGGSMRQAGVIAAAGIVAIQEMIERLADDHANAKVLAEGLGEIDGVAIDASRVETNLVFFEVVSDEITAAQVSAALKQRGVLINAVGGRRMRAVLNHHVTTEDVHYTLSAVADAMREGAQAPQGKVAHYQ